MSETRQDQPTPGPWKTGWAGGITGPTAVNWNDDTLFPVSKPDGCPGFGASVVALVPIADPNWETNALLIAAAPDLLLALQLLHDDIAEYARINYLGGFDNHAMLLARAAIAKANGAA